jgi:chromosome segregation ATPase
MLFSLIIQKQQQDHRDKLQDLKSKLATDSKEIVEGYKFEIEDLKKRLEEVHKEKNKYLDEKLKIEEIIDKQVEQIDYFNNKAMKLEDELVLRKQLNDEVTSNLRAKEEEIRVLKLEKIENVIKSFDVQFVNIEEHKSTQEILTDGTVQTCQSLENNKDYFLRITYKSQIDKRVKTFKVEADRLGAIIPITESRAAIQWKDEKGGNKKQVVELTSPEDLLLEVGNLTYR